MWRRAALTSMMWRSSSTTASRWCATVLHQSQCFTLADYAAATTRLSSITRCMIGKPNLVMLHPPWLVLMPDLNDIPADDRGLCAPHRPYRACRQDRCDTGAALVQQTPPRGCAHLHSLLAISPLSIWQASTLDLGAHVSTMPDESCSRLWRPVLSCRTMLCCCSPGQAAPIRSSAARQTSRGQGS
jgi:hypothetical protein